MALIEIHNLTFSYPEQSQCLHQINLTIQQGDFVVLMGPSGCGKTTLLKQLKTELAPNGDLQGTILFNGTALTNLPPKRAAAEIGFVMQNPDNQIVTDKVWHELAFGLENLGLDPLVIRRRVAEIANFFGIQHWFHKQTTELSGGQKQLLNLAAVLIMQPKVLLLDEPTAQLDPIAANNFLSTLNRIHEELGITIILIEHRLEEILAVANRVVAMDNGTIIFDGSPRNMMQNIPDTLLPSLPTPMKVFSTVPKGSVPITIREGQKWLANQTVSDPVTSSTTQKKTNIILEAKNISFRYEKAGPAILHNFSFTLHEGQIYTILGGNGTGKSTALQVLTGLYNPQQGDIWLYGKKLKKYSQEQLYRNIFALLPQDPKTLFMEKKVKKELVKMAEEFNQSQEISNQIIDQLHLEYLLNRHPYDLSGGEQQKLALAKMLLRQPKILFLDEPTKGLDAYSKQEIATILKQLTEQGMTIVIVSHDIEFSAEHADYCALFFDGSLISEGVPRDFFTGNYFYTTAAHRMSRHLYENLFLWEEVSHLCKPKSIK